MFVEATTKREILVTVAFRVLTASVLTVVGIVGVAYLATMLEFSKTSIIASSVLAGICGFVFGVYWTMAYLVKSGYSTKQ